MRYGATCPPSCGEKRWFLAAAALCLLIAGCASLQNTAAQDVALSRWTVCHAQVYGTELRRLELDGRIWFWHNGPADRSAMLDCLRQAAKGGPMLPEPVPEPRPGGGGGGGM